MEPMSHDSGYARITGPCGDTMGFRIPVEEDRISKVSLITDGCDPSRACGLMTNCMAGGKTVVQARQISRQGNHDHCALLTTDTLKAIYEHDMSKSQKEGDKIGKPKNMRYVRRFRLRG